MERDGEPAPGQRGRWGSKRQVEREDPHSTNNAEGCSKMMIMHIRIHPFVSPRDLDKRRRRGVCRGTYL